MDHSSLFLFFLRILHISQLTDTIVFLILFIQSYALILSLTVYALLIFHKYLPHKY